MGIGDLLDVWTTNASTLGEYTSWNVWDFLFAVIQGLNCKCYPTLIPGSFVPTKIGIKVGVVFVRSSLGRLYGCPAREEMECVPPTCVHHPWLRFFSCDACLKRMYVER